MDDQFEIDQYDRKGDGKHHRRHKSVDRILILRAAAGGVSVFRTLGLVFVVVHLYILICACRDRGCIAGSVLMIQRSCLVIGLVGDVDPELFEQIFVGM